RDDHRAIAIRRDRARSEDARHLSDQHLLRRRRHAHGLHHFVGHRPAGLDAVADPGTEAQLQLTETTMAGNGQMIIDLDKKRMHAMAQKDVATLNDVLADDLVYTHSSARLDTKQSLIGNMQSGATVYTSVEPSDVKAQDLGDVVVLTGVCQIKVVSNGTPNA